MGMILLILRQVFYDTNLFDIFTPFLSNLFSIYMIFTVKFRQYWCLHCSLSALPATTLYWMFLP